MQRYMFWMCAVLALGPWTLGCGQSEPAPQAAATPEAGASDYLLSAEPAGAQGVGAARAADAGGPVTLVGRIGGSSDPFVEGLAAFQLVDAELAPCPADEGCPTPWDYCCEPDKVAKNIATVKVVGGDGQVVAQDARELLKVKELSTVVVQGEAQRDAEGNLTVLADKVYVKSL